jgi:D-arabinose 1-dehydrogenase-like Zn-dependent alcohol dehydrogenase
MEVVMKALVYHGPGKKAWEDVADATIQEATDVVVKVDTTTICGTDLHILQGDVAAVTEGRILGHEAVGTVTEVGDAIKGFEVGDRVLVPELLAATCSASSRSTAAPPSSPPTPRPGPELEAASRMECVEDEPGRHELALLDYRRT